MIIKYCDACKKVVGKGIALKLQLVKISKSQSVYGGEDEESKEYYDVCEDCFDHFKEILTQQLWNPDSILDTLKKAKAGEERESKF